MIEYMHNFDDEPAAIDCSQEDRDIFTVYVEDITRTFNDYDKAVNYLYRLGYRF